MFLGSYFHSDYISIVNLAVAQKPISSAQYKYIVISSIQCGFCANQNVMPSYTYRFFKYESAVRILPDIYVLKCRFAFVL